MEKMLLTLFAFCCLSIGSFAQFETLVVEEIDNKGLVEGKTYRIYVVVQNEGDQVLAVFGEPGNELYFRSTTDFHQNKFGGLFAADINHHLVEEKPELAYDSWLTIAYEDNRNNNVQKITGDFEPFENGQNLELADAAWFVTPDNGQATAQEDKRILIAQLTSTGKITGRVGIYGRTGTNTLNEDGSPRWENWKETNLTFTCGE